MLHFFPNGINSLLLYCVESTQCVFNLKRRKIYMSYWHCNIYKQDHRYIKDEVGLLGLLSLPWTHSP